MRAEFDLTVKLDLESQDSLRSQLSQRLREQIAFGVLQRGDLMPPSRGLAQSLQVSRGTVVAAYEQLIGEGYLESRPGAGTVVAVLPFADSPAPQALVPLVPRAAKVQPADRAIIDLRPGLPSTVGLSDPAWRSAWRRASQSDPRPGEHDPLGMASFRSSIAEHLRRARGVTCQPDDIIVTAGTSDAMALIAIALSQSGHRPRIAVENPGYPAVRRIFSTLGAEAVPVPLVDGSLSLSALADVEELDAVVVTPSHHYPTGGRMSVPSRVALLAWAAKTDTIIVEDDYDSEFRYDLAPLPALASLDTGNHVALVGSFSKVVTPSLRCGYIVSRGELGRVLRQTRATLDSPVSEVQQLALAAYIDSGALARHISRARRDYRHRRDNLIARVSAMQNVTVSGTDGGLHAVIAVPTDEGHLVNALAERGVLVSRLSDYWIDPADSTGDALVIGYAGSTTTELNRGLDILHHILTTQ